MTTFADRVKAAAARITRRIVDATPVTRTLRPRPLGQDGDRPSYPRFLDAGCRRCCDMGVVARNTPCEWENIYQGRPLRGRYLDPCPEVGCKARVREFGA